MTRPETDAIEIRGLRVFAHHGVLAQEKRDGQWFLIDLTLHGDLSAAAESDQLGDTVDYATLATRLAGQVRGTRFHLLERLAGHLLDVAMEDPLVQSAEIRIAKPQAPVIEDLGEVAVRLQRSR